MKTQARSRVRAPRSGRRERERSWWRRIGRLVWLYAAFAIVMMGVIWWHLVDEALLDIIVRVPPGRVPCLRWVEHLREAGYRVRIEEDELGVLRGRLHVPMQLKACHTALTMQGRYVIEGHVPADVIARVLRERPQIRGVAVPGSPRGAPGLEGPTAEAYEIWILRVDGRTTLFQRRNGAAAPEKHVRAEQGRVGHY